VLNPLSLNRIGVNEVIRLRDLLEQPAQHVCLLAPYRDRLEENEPLSRQVNAHLVAMNLTLHDSGFALVIVNGDKVNVQILSVARHNIMFWHEAVQRIAKPLGCAQVDRVLVTRTYDGWLVFGEER